jgi:parallel beta-helix repeat protein
VHDNGEGPQIPYPHTDGNGIIIDTTLGSSTCPTCGTPYPGDILVLGNISYNNGGGGIHVFLSQNVTVANNTVYNNYLDQENPGTARGELSNGGSKKITWLNNIAYANPGTGILAYNTPTICFTVSGGFSISNTWTDNITFGAPASISQSTNMVSINPQLTNPPGANFIPVKASPAIGAAKPESYIPVKKPNIGAYYGTP